MEQNDRYETRFRDVVGAYKNVLKEKTALEATVSALSSGGQEADKAGESGGDGGGGGDQKGEGNLVDGTALKSKVATLAKALATLTEEKASNEARFQADKKKVADGFRARIQQAEDNAETEITSLKDQLENVEAERDGLKATSQQAKESLKAAHKLEKTRAEVRACVMVPALCSCAPSPSPCSPPPLHSCSTRYRIYHGSFACK